MIDFLWLVLKAPAWTHVVLIACAIVVWWAYDLRALTALSAWVALALFFVWVAASNSWRLLPHPVPSDHLDMASYTEAWRFWAVELRETLILAYLAAAAISLGVASWFVWGAYTQTLRFTMLTALYMLTTFLAQTGEVMQRYVCSTTSPNLGNEHIFWANGRSEGACARLFVEIFQSMGVSWAEPVGAFIGPLFFPFLTVIWLFVILWKTRHKFRKVRVPRQS